MRNLYVFCFLTVCFFLTSNAQDFKIKYYHPKTGLPASIEFPVYSSNYPNQENVGRWMVDNLQANASFRLVYQRSFLGQDSLQHVRYRQYYGRFPVESGDVVMHVKGNRTCSLNGRFFPKLQLDTTISLTSKQALDIAKGLFPGAVFQWEVASEEKLLKLARGNQHATYLPTPQLLAFPTSPLCRNEDFRLVYMVDIYAYEPHSRKHIYIDARTGEVLQQLEQICTVDRLGIAHTKYSGTQSIMCDSVSADTFYLRESGRGGGIITYNYKGHTSKDTSEVFMDGDNDWDNVNGTQDEVATDVHWGSEMTYDYYKQVFNRNSFNDSGAPILSRVHFDSSFRNAFWNGEFASYGDGNYSPSKANSFRPLTSLDICAHELTHGHTQWSAGLIYMNESGAMNESFSDVFGKSVEYFALPGQFSWNMASNIQADGKPFRNMADPNTRNHPKFYYGAYFFDYNSSQDDQGGVHTNSGVQNYWFYLLCHGGSGNREDNGKPWKVDSIGIDKAARIAYLNLTGYLYPWAEYLDDAYLSLDAATALYGLNSFERKQVKTAWFAVGLINDNDVSSPSYQQAWTLMPNPAGSSITLSNPLVGNTCQVQISDITGRVVHSQNIIPGEAMDISQLANGVYFISVEGSVLKFVKE